MTGYRRAPCSSRVPPWLARLPRRARERAPHELRHLGEAHLGELQVAAGIAPDAVGPRVHRAPTGEHLPVRREHGDARDLVGDVDGPAGIDIDVHRLVEVAPLAVEVALGAEELHPVVLAVGHEDPIARVDPNAAGSRELTAPETRSAPRLHV